MTANWVDSATSTLGADSSFHSGVTVDLIQGNMERVISQSGFDLQCFHTSSLAPTHAFSTVYAWEDLTPEWDSWAIPVRKSLSGGRRGLKIFCEGMVAPAAIATIRFYVLNQRFSSLTPHTTYALMDQSSYGSMIFSTSSYVIQSTSISINVTPHQNGLFWNESTTIPETPVDIYYVHAVGYCNATRTVTLRAPRFKEIP